MQRLEVNVKDPVTGKEKIKEVWVYRSWQTATGAQIYLHKDGTYGYKDGSPVIHERELSEVIPPGPHRDLAMRWWVATGKALSEAFYTAKTERDRQMALSHLGTVRDHAVDQILYALREKGQKKWAAPVAWHGLFPERPAWWGVAEDITINGQQYKMHEPQDAGPSGHGLDDSPEL